MMELYLLRHALAADRGTPGVEDDSRRPLTPEGRDKMHRIAMGMGTLGLSFDRIVSSPFERAKATAEIVAGALTKGGRLAFSEHLTPTGNPSLLVRELRRHRGPDQRLLVVGHEPFLSRFAGTLMGGGASVKLKFKKGGLGKLTIDRLEFGPCAELEWLLTPRHLTLLARRATPQGGGRERKPTN